MQNKNIFYYINIFKKWKKLLIILLLLVAAVSATAAFLLPPWYYSSASVKPLEEENMGFFSAMLSAKGLGNLGKNLNIGGLQYSDLDYYKSLLLSRKISEKMINKFDLYNLYENQYYFQTFDELKANSVIETDSKSNLLILGVFDKDPERAQLMVEYYISLLDSTLREISSVSSDYNKELITGRYKANLKDIEEVEQKMEQFHQKYGIIIPEEQIKGTIQTATKIEAEKLFLEVKLASISEIQGAESPSAKNLEIQIKTLQNKINSIQGDQTNDDGHELFVSLGVAPEILSEYMRIYREMEIQTQLLELIYPLYEQVKMQSTEKAPRIIVIDKPYLPEYKVKPKRAYIIITSLAFALIFCIIFIFSFEYIKNQKAIYHKDV